MDYPVFIKRFFISFIFSLGIVFIHFLLGLLIKDYLPQLDWNSEVGDRGSRVFTLESKEKITSYFNIFYNFDSTFYMYIVKNGYEQDVYYRGIGMKSWAFYPLYPLLIIFVSNIFSITDIEAVFYIGVVFSFIFMVGTFVLLSYVLEKLQYDFKSWLLFVSTVLLYPVSYFLHIFYTESLFFLLSSLFFLLILNKKYFLSVVTIILASLTRSFGILLIVPLIVSLLLDKSSNFSDKVLRGSVMMLLSSFGLIGFFTYLYTLTADFFTPIKIQAEWSGRGESSSFIPFKLFFIYFRNIFEKPYLVNSFESAGVLAALIAIMLLIFLFLKRGQDKTFLILLSYYLSYLMFLTATNTSTSITRYLLVLVPFHIALLELYKSHRASFYILLVIFCLVHTLYLTFFVLRIPSPAV